MKKRTRIGLSILIILLTLLAFTYYISKHSYLLKQLVHTPPIIIVWLLLLYGGLLMALGLILRSCLRICRVTMPVKENLLLNTYSLLANFFVIGQVGPGIRAAYLKKNYKLLIRKFLYVTLIYYICYAAVSTLILLIGSTIAWWLTLLIVLIVAAVSILVIRLHRHRSKNNKDRLDLNLSTLSYLVLATLFQVLLQFIIYKVELHNVNSHLSVKQTMAYTGVANLALFVGLTPGAIGIRESFLVFSERLHHISSANIVSANVIDRAVYTVFLAILFVVLISFHAKNRFSLKDSSNLNEVEEELDQTD